MKKLLVLVCATAALSMVTGSAIADTIAGRIGVTGKAGFVFPTNNNHDTDTGFIGGGGFIYGFDRNFAGEIDITNSVYGSDIGDFSVIDIALGAQYRFLPGHPQLVPFVGAGFDLLINDVERDRSVDSTIGAHASAGVDFFITRQFALTAEARLLVAPKVDINGPSGKEGDFNPTSVATTFGVRYFFN